MPIVPWNYTDDETGNLVVIFVEREDSSIGVVLGNFRPFNYDDVYEHAYILKVPCEADALQWYTEYFNNSCRPYPDESGSDEDEDDCPKLDIQEAMQSYRDFMQLLQSAKPILDMKDIKPSQLKPEFLYVKLLEPGSTDIDPDDMTWLADDMYRDYRKVNEIRRQQQTIPKKQKVKEAWEEGRYLGQINDQVVVFNSGKNGKEIIQSYQKHNQKIYYDGGVFKTVFLVFDPPIVVPKRECGLYPQTRLLNEKYQKLFFKYTCKPEYKVVEVDGVEKLMCRYLAIRLDWDDGEDDGEKFREFCQYGKELVAAMDRTNPGA